MLSPNQVTDALPGEGKCHGDGTCEVNQTWHVTGPTSGTCKTTWEKNVETLGGDYHGLPPTFFCWKVKNLRGYIHLYPPDTMMVLDGRPELEL